MHDPLTVAFEIRSPIARKSEFFKNGYRAPLVTIWHEDPLHFEGKCGRLRSDDSCGWFCPPYSPVTRDAVRGLAKEQYSQIFEKQVRTAEGADYARVCNEPDCHSAIYWSWRAIKHKFKPRGPWQYGVRLTAGEREEIYDLATCPVDNLKMTFQGVHDLESFEGFFFTVFHVYLRHHRPWYRHPRWHFWHWRFQIHPLQKLTRRLFTRCAACGKPFGWNESPTGTWGGNTVWHSKCFPVPAAKVPGAKEGVFHAVTPDLSSDTRH